MNNDRRKILNAKYYHENADERRRIRREHYAGNKGARMAAKPPKYVLGGKGFKTKKEIKEYFQEYIKKAVVGDELIGETHDAMVDLVKMHPLYDEWKVEGEPTFIIGKDLYKNKNFGIKHGDMLGAATFSYSKCIAARSSAVYHKHNVASAARHAILPQIDGYIKNVEVKGDDAVEDPPALYKCEISGDMCLRENVHVDHNFDVTPFNSLLLAWLTKTGRDYGDVKLRHIPEGGHRFEADDATSWKAYHKDKAQLRILRKDINLKGGRKRTLMPIP